MSIKVRNDGIITIIKDISKHELFYSKLKNKFFLFAYLGSTNACILRVYIDANSFESIRLEDNILYVTPMLKHWLPVENPPPIF